MLVLERFSFEQPRWKIAVGLGWVGTGWVRDESGEDERRKKKKRDEVK